MGIDPQTGMYTPDVSYQPTGALGAVTNLLNAQKAQQIADTLQQQREAQASLEQQQAQEYGAATQRANQARQAMAGALQQPGGTLASGVQAAAPYLDTKEVIPALRASESAGARLGAAAMQGLSREIVARINNGEPIESIRYSTIMQQGISPQSVDQAIEMAQGPQPGETGGATPSAEPTAGSQDTAGMPGSNLQGPAAPGGMSSGSPYDQYRTNPLPVAAGKAAAAQGIGARASAQAGQIPANDTAKRDLQAAQALLARSKAAVAKKAALEPWEVTELNKNLRAAQVTRAKYATGVGAIINPDVAPYIEQLDKAIADIQNQIKMKTSGNSTTPYTPPTNYTPFTGSTQPTGGTVTRQINLPPLPGQQ